MTAKLSAAACKQQVLDALAAVRDPEIDEPIGSLSFVVDVIVEQGEVEVIVRPPTSWCPSNFVFLIAEDMRAAVLRLDWVRGFKIKLLEHFSEDEITLGINERRSFASVFPGQAGNSIASLRREFDLKALMMRQRNLLLALQQSGVAADVLLAVTIDQAREILVSDEEQRLFADYLEKANALGIDSSSRRLVSEVSGQPVADLNAHLRKIKVIAANAAANGEMCRMLVTARRQMSCSVVPVAVPVNQISRKVGRSPQPAVS